MTPLYFDNAKGGLTSRDGKLLECCCCEYCCGKFGTGVFREYSVLMVQEPFNMILPTHHVLIQNF